MFKHEKSIFYVRLADAHSFTIITDNLLMKTHKYTVEHPIYYCRPSSYVQGLDDQSEVMEVANEYHTGWTFIAANKQQALLKMPETVGTGYIVCDLVDYLTLTGLGRLEMQELVWLTEDKANMRLTSKVVAESEGTNKYITTKSTLNACDLGLDHVGLILRRLQGRSFVYGIVDGDCTGANIRICGENVSQTPNSKEWEVMDIDPLSTQEVEAYHVWKNIRFESGFGAYSWQEAIAQCALLAPATFSKISLCDPVYLTVLSERAQSTFPKNCLKAPLDWFITGSMWLPTDVNNYACSESSLSSNSWKRIDLVGKNSPENPYYLKMQICEDKKGTKLRMSVMCITGIELTFKIFKATSREHASALLSAILRKNNLKILLARTSRAEDSAVTLPPTSKNALFLDFRLKFDIQYFNS